MRMLIIACNGQLGVDATRYFSGKYEVLPYKDVELDITDREKVVEAFQKDKPDVVLNCAAITNVDGCEAKPELAFAVNATGAGIVAQAAQSVGATLVHVSTDYVFAGDGKKPYLETDPVDPKNVYGESKLRGEQEVVKNCQKHFIMRTAWLYGHNGNNFVKTMLKVGAEKGEVSVVTDQVGNPTSTMELIRMIEAVLKTDKYGVYHATCEGICSWNEFAREIFHLANMDVKVLDITSEKLVRAAHRPSFSVLCKDKIANNAGYRPAVWKDALAEYFHTGE